MAQPDSSLSRLTLSHLHALAVKATANVERVKGVALTPTNAKTPPSFPTARIAELTGLSPEQVMYRIKSKSGIDADKTKSIGDTELPAGTVTGRNNRRAFTVAETSTWSRAFRKDRLRPAAARCATLTIGNFKGGVTKTTTAMTLAQGLSLRGHKVLAIDLDPQGSLTTLFGVLPKSQESDKETLLPVFSGQEESVMYSVRQTYWSGLDVIKANPMLTNAEFNLPVLAIARRTGNGSDIPFYKYLDVALEEARDHYDVIIIDTPPTLSYLSMNGYMAADGLIVPIPPSFLEFASSAQFWTLFSDLITQLDEYGADLSFDFLHILLAKVEAGDEKVETASEWIRQTYGEHVLPVEIPKTRAATSTAQGMGTVYDVTAAEYDGSVQTYTKALTAYNRVVDLVEASIVQGWKLQLIEQAKFASKQEAVV